VVDRLLVIEDGHLVDYQGNYADYLAIKG
jgi:hypothetical protein